LVDYGIDLETDQTVVLPNIHPKEIGGVFDKTYNEYILEYPHHKDTQNV
jgi:hypothetical protein